MSPSGTIQVDPVVQTAKTGTVITFNCSAGGGPNNTYFWTHDNSTSGIDDLNELDILSLKSTLTLESINGANGGLYTCIAVNEAGSDNSTVTLYVRPEITTQPTDQFVDPGDTVTLTCIADSFPAPTYQWQRMNTTTSEFEDLFEETVTTYTINDVEHEDFGIYRCVVTTPTINVTINSKDTIIAGKFYTKIYLIDFTFQFPQMKVFLLNHHF